MPAAALNCWVSTLWSISASLPRQSSSGFLASLHISLSTWLRDYLYIRSAEAAWPMKTAAISLITMVLAGLWTAQIGLFSSLVAIHGVCWLSSGIFFQPNLNLEVYTFPQRSSVSFPLGAEILLSTFFA